MEIDFFILFTELAKVGSVELFDFFKTSQFLTICIFDQFKKNCYLVREIDFI